MLLSRFCYLLLAYMLVFAPSRACTIFIANDGRQVWVGNNEDEDPALRYRLWYYPAINKHNGYMIWTELSPDGKMDSLMYHIPQGGMNDKGLFMDYTAIDELPVLRDPSRQDRETEIVTDLLQQCGTVAEALQFIERFNLVRLTGAQLFIADENGDYATVHGSYVMRRSTPDFALTNYRVNDGHYEACWRRDAALAGLNSGQSRSLKNIVDLLQQTTQKKPGNLVSNYSMAIALKDRRINLYYKNDFSTPLVLSLGAELKKGAHYRDMDGYFPQAIGPVLRTAYTAGGIDRTVKVYDSLRGHSPTRYNFGSDEALDVALQLLAKEKPAEALRLLESIRHFDPGKQTLNAWCGVASRKLGKAAESDRCFASALAADPDNYVATLFGKQAGGTVTFRMNDFGYAQLVNLVSDSARWPPAPMKKDAAGAWTCTLQLPPGTYRYKFIVNGIYLADQVNLLRTGFGPDIYSILYVW